MSSTVVAAYPRRANSLVAASSITRRRSERDSRGEREGAIRISYQIVYRMVTKRTLVRITELWLGLPVLRQVVAPDLGRITDPLAGDGIEVEHFTRPGSHMDGRTLGRSVLG